MHVYNILGTTKLEFNKHTTHEMCANAKHGATYASLGALYLRCHSNLNSGSSSSFYVRHIYMTTKHWLQQAAATVSNCIWCHLASALKIYLYYNNTAATML